MQSIFNISLNECVYYQLKAKINRNKKGSKMLKRGDTFQKLAHDGLNTPYNISAHQLKTEDTMNIGEPAAQASEIGRAHV